MDRRSEKVGRFGAAFFFTRIRLVWDPTVASVFIEVPSGALSLPGIW